MSKEWRGTCLEFTEASVGSEGPMERGGSGCGSGDITEGLAPTVKP